METGLVEGTYLYRVRFERTPPKAAA